MKGEIVGYVRVSSHTQEDDLERQIELIKSYAEEKDWEVEILKDMGSGRVTTNGDKDDDTLQ